MEIDLKLQQVENDSLFEQIAHQFSPTIT